jgi:hypothetical protein
VAYSRVRRFRRRVRFGWPRLTPARRGYLLGVLTTALIALVAACGTAPRTTQADQNAQQYTSRQSDIYDRGQPLHLYDYSQDRASYLAIYDARVAGKATYQVSVPALGGQPWYSCPSRGYPIPATSQLTNPEYGSVPPGFSSLIVTLPQPEPNGLYSGPTDGTYMQCVDTDGSLYSVYSEPPVLAFPFAVTWTADRGFVKANPNDRASYSLPTAPPGQGNATTVPAPSPTAGR